MKLYVQLFRDSYVACQLNRVWHCTRFGACVCLQACALYLFLIFSFVFLVFSYFSRLVADLLINPHFGISSDHALAIIDRHLFSFLIDQKVVSFAVIKA